MDGWMEGDPTHARHNLLRALDGRMDGSFHTNHMRCGMTGFPPSCRLRCCTGRGVRAFDCPTTTLTPHYLPTPKSITPSPSTGAALLGALLPAAGRAGSGGQRRRRTRAGHARRGTGCLFGGPGGVRRGRAECVGILHAAPGQQKEGREDQTRKEEMEERAACLATRSHPLSLVNTTVLPPAGRALPDRAGGLRGLQPGGVQPAALHAHELLVPPRPRHPRLRRPLQPGTGARHGPPVIDAARCGGRLVTVRHSRAWRFFASRDHHRPSTIGLGSRSSPAVLIHPPPCLLLAT